MSDVASRDRAMCEAVSGAVNRAVYGAVNTMKVD